MPKYAMLGGAITGICWFAGLRLFQRLVIGFVDFPFTSEVAMASPGSVVMVIVMGPLVVVVVVGSLVVVVEVLVVVVGVDSVVQVVVVGAIVVVSVEMVVVVHVVVVVVVGSVFAVTFTVRDARFLAFRVVSSALAFAAPTLDGLFDFALEWSTVSQSEVSITSESKVWN